MIIVFVLMTISLLVSQSFMDLMSFVIILCGLWAWKQQTTRANRKFQFHSLGLEKLWMAWICVFAIGLMLEPLSMKELASHPSPWFSRWMAITELKWIVNFYFFIWFFEWLLPWESLKEENLLKKTNPWMWVASSLLAFSIYGLIGLIFNYDLIKQQPLSDTGRVGGLFDDPMTFAHVYALFFILFFFITLQRLTTQQNRPSSKRKFSATELFLALTTACCGLAVFLSMTRGVWIGIFISLLISMFLYRKKFGLVFLSSSSGLLVLLFLTWSRFQDRVLFVFNSDSYDSERVWLWKANWQMFLDHPFFGIGYGTYKWKLRDYFDLLGAPAKQFESHAHNQYLHFLAGTGFFGLACFLFFVSFNLWQGWRFISLTQNPNLKEKYSSLRGFAFGLFAAQICFLTAALTESNFERAKVRWTYLILVSLGFAAVRALTSSKIEAADK